MISSKTIRDEKSSSKDPLLNLTKEQLLAQLAATSSRLAELEAENEKKKRNSNLLVAASPSPRKKISNVLGPVTGSSSSKVATKKSLDLDYNKILKPTLSSTNSFEGPSGISTTIGGKCASLPKTKNSSNFAREFENLRQEVKNHNAIQSIPRSTSFTSRPQCSGKSRLKNTEDEKKDSTKLLKMTKEVRADDLTLKVDIPFGPVHYEAPSSDPNFLKLEPNSGIRLRTRWLSHQVVQDHLSDRHIVRINSLYSIIRKVDDKKFGSRTKWDIPLMGDWILIGVLAEKGEYRTTNPDSKKAKKAKDSSVDNSEQKKKEKKNNSDESCLVGDPCPEFYNEDDRDEFDQSKLQFKTWHQTPKNFVTFKLVDFSSSQASQSGSGMVKMILFESDEVVTGLSQSNGSTGYNKTFRGGSGGAYEKFWKSQPGTVFAILNPNILKGLSEKKKGCETLSITPTSAQSLLQIGLAQDLGSCTAMRETGRECGNWCDLRACGSGEGSSKPLSICEYHLHKQVGKVRNGRAEFFSGTLGMKTHTGRSFKDGCNWPSSSSSKISAKPNQRLINGQNTYICGGGGGGTYNRNDKNRDRWIDATDTERLDGLQRRRKRELEEIEIKKMLKEEGNGKDAKRSRSYGAQCVEDARKIKQLKNNYRSKASPHDTIKSNHLETNNQNNDNVEEDCVKNDESELKRKSAFSTSAIRAIGFDPTASKSLSSKKALTQSGTAQQSKNLSGLLECTKVGPVNLPSSSPRSIPLNASRNSSVNVKDFMFQATSKTIKSASQKYIELSGSEDDE
ncbi:expressed protein [Phakopsora pachyrhizi]|uniref:Expressed protein n=1 Tax=Phakopsora pachyrhizi TaxID=170000 RepID=A0AAV0AQ28_PHAPC|nr:expressed protein [Phakopsora pachyrhizi]